MTIRKAQVFYLAVVLIVVVVAWALAYFVAWWDGMVLLTIVVADHMRYTLKQIRKNT